MKPSFRLIVVAVGIALAAAQIAPAAGASPPAAAAIDTPPASTRVLAQGRLASYPGAEVVVASEVGGVIETFELVEKARVERGAVIAELRAADLRAELSAARARLDEAEAERRLALSELERAIRLHQQEIDSASRRDAALRDLEVARAREGSAQAEVKRLEARIAKYRITAPIDGTVIRRFVNAGETIDAGAAIVVLADLDRVRVEAEIDEIDAGHVTVGAPVSIAAEGWGDMRWKGTVEEIPDAVSGRVLKPQDSGTRDDHRVLLVKIRLDQPTPLKLGQRVEVELQIEE